MTRVDSDPRSLPEAILDESHEASLECAKITIAWQLLKCKMHFRLELHNFY